MHKLNTMFVRVSFNAKLSDIVLTPN